MSEKRPPLKPVYGIWGEDRGKVDRAVARLQHRVVDEGGLPPDEFDATGDLADDVVGVCQTLSFSGRRLVIVRNAEAWRAGDVGPLLSYLESPVADTCLALVSSAAPTPKLVSAIGTHGDVLEFGPKPKASRRERAAWFVSFVESECVRAGARLPAALARVIVERVGEDAMALSQEAIKLASAAGPEGIDRELVDLLVIPHPDAKSYELADAVTAGDRARVFTLLDELATGDHPSEPIVIQMSLARHFRGVAAAQALGPGASPDDVSRVTGLKGYPAQKVVEQARALPDGAADRCVARLAALELDLRVGALTDLGRSPDDGRRFVLERAARDLLAAVRG